MKPANSKKMAPPTAVPDPVISKCEDAANLLRAMANPTRLHILCLLAERERPVGEIATSIAIRDQATSQHLAQLRLEGLIVARKEAQRVYYRLASTKIERVLQTLREIYGEP